MQTLLEFWTASPFFAAIVVGLLLIFAGMAISAATDVIQMLINGVVRLFRGHPPTAKFQFDSDDIDRLADAVRDRINEVNVSAADLRRFAAIVMELADQRRAEREKAKAERKTKDIVVMPCTCGATVIEVSTGKGDFTCYDVANTLIGDTNALVGHTCPGAEELALAAAEHQ